ncbi:glycoside hydrolase family 3 protein [Candidatus Protochlamydia sp. W-9]|uniref:glycoside hydrolase family 3 protein n=1 Tax=Candidatus Protochlamydia sp. W-9 TaxID=1785087 RepID=UPI00096ABEBC|nr:glycoside hydrolase family 3 protein [Candidatus Protochlamydia sp. W-9]
MFTIISKKFPFIYKKNLLLLFFLFVSLKAENTVPKLEDLTLEEKIGQLLIVHFRGEDCNKEALQMIYEAHVGGIIYYPWSNGLNSPLQIQHLSAHLQAAAFQKKNKIPLLISVDQEGGVVNRLTKEMTLFPGNYALGQTKDPQLAFEYASASANELLAMGINMNLAPVIDVNTQPCNPVIGIRSFSTCPDEVVRFGSKVVEGFNKAGLIATLKHFPGHGDTNSDSHHTLPIVNKTLVELEKVELVPFRALASQAPVVMTAHLLVPALDALNCVTFSKSAIDVLRKEVGEKGIILTDSLVMQGVLQDGKTVEQAALKSLQAGHDLLLLGGKRLLNESSEFELEAKDILKIHQFLVNAVRQNLISEARIDISVKRILTLKESYHLFQSKEDDLQLRRRELSLQKNQALAKKIAEKALNNLNEDLKISFQNPRITLIAPDILKEELEKTDWLTPNQNVQVILFDANLKEFQTVLEKCQEINVCVFFFYNHKKYPNHLDFFNFIKAHKNSEMIAVVVADSNIQHDLADVTLYTYSPCAVSLQCAKEYLMTIFEE